MTDLLTRLRAMTDHRGDGIPTQSRNPDGEEAAREIERLREALGAVQTVVTETVDLERLHWTTALLHISQMVRAALNPRTEGDE
jgi:hypothetical protein